MIAFVDRTSTYGHMALSGSAAAAPRRRNGPGPLPGLAVAVLLLTLLGAVAPSFIGSVAPSGSVDRAEVPIRSDRSIDPDALAAQTSHLFIADPAEPGTLTVRDARYAGRFDATGFTLAPSSGEGSGFAVSLQSLGRTQDIPIVRGGWAGDGNVARRSVAPGITEQVTASEGSVEWDVVLDRAPAGSGDLVVRADVSGSLSSAPGEALTWTVEGHTVSMGEIVVKDAGGKELHRALPTATSTGVVLTVPAGVLAEAAYPLTIDPVVSPRYPVTDGSPTASTPDIAFDGTNYLIVWTDTKGGTYTRVYGARLNPSGVRLDGTGFNISNDSSSSASGDPSVSFDGTNFFVVWTTYDWANAPGDTSYIRGKRISRAGTVLDPAPVPISAGNRRKGQSAVSFDGTNHLVVWADDRAKPYYDIYATRVSPSGAVQPEFLISQAPGDQTLPEVASDGTNSLIVWMDARSGDWEENVYGTLIAGTGGAISPDGVLISSAERRQHAPSVAWNGKRYLAAWGDDRSGNRYDIYGSRISALGVVEDPSGIAISTAWDNQTDPSVAANGLTFLVAWVDRRNGDPDLYGSRVNDAGVPSDKGGFVITSGVRWDGRPAVTKGSGSTWAIAFEDRLTGPDYDPGSVSMTTVAPK